MRTCSGANGQQRWRSKAQGRGPEVASGLHGVRLPAGATAGVAACRAFAARGVGGGGVLRARRSNKPLTGSMGHIRRSSTEHIASQPCQAQQPAPANWTVGIGSVHSAVSMAGRGGRTLSCPSSAGRRLPAGTVLMKTTVCSPRPLGLTSARVATQCIPHEMISAFRVHSERQAPHTQPHCVHPCMLTSAGSLLLV